MTKSTNAVDYFHRLQSAIEGCKSIAPEDRAFSHRKDASKRIWLVVRGFEVPQSLFGADPLAAKPFGLVRGGALRFRVQIREERAKHATTGVEVVEYRFHVDGLDKDGNPNQVECFRYDRPAGQRRGLGWDADLDDNPEHPHGHLHINFLVPDANELRMPTGVVCPILLIKAFDYWYYTTYVR